MIKQIAWNTFKNTGDINAYMEFKLAQNIEEKMEVDKNENNKSKWDSNSGK